MIRTFITLIAVGISFSSFATTTQDKIAKAITNLDLKQMKAVLVQHNNKRIYQQYFDDFSKDDKHNVRSASKSFTSLLFGIAMQQGKFQSLQDKVLPVFPNYLNEQNSFSKKQNMTFFQLLSMTNPLECNDTGEVLVIEPQAFF